MYYPYPPAPFPQKGGECGAAALTPLGATPQTPFSKKYWFFDRLKYGCLVKQPYFMKVLTEKSVFFCNSLSLRNAIYGADGSTEMTAYAL